MKETLPCNALEIGMFVSALDRPWLGTPFLLQGFLIEAENEIALLQHHCQSVTVDFERSAGAHFKDRVRANPAAKFAQTKGTSFRQYDDANAAEPEDFLNICRLLNTRSLQQRYAHPPSLNPADGQSRLESELLYSAPIIEDIKQTLESIRIALDLNDNAKIAQIGVLVSELGESVKRNPDALLWLTRLKSADRYSYDHAVDVSVYLMILGRFLNLPEANIYELGLVGMLQDIGKVDLPQDILNKAEHLSDEEYVLVQSHVESSLEMLGGQPGFTPELLDIVRSHHERHDGSGYPRRLAGERISLCAELAGLIDTYCAMTRNRAYNTAVSHQRALEALLTLRGQKFRAPLVDQFIQCMGLYPVGTLVELSTGEVAVVIQQNRIRRLQPRVLVVLAEDKSVERYPRTLDLMMNPQTPTHDNYRILRSLAPDAYGIDPTEFYLG